MRSDSSSSRSMGTGGSAGSRGPSQAYRVAPRIVTRPERSGNLVAVPRSRAQPEQAERRFVGMPEHVVGELQQRHDVRGRRRRVPALARPRSAGAGPPPARRRRRSAGARGVGAPVRGPERRGAPAACASQRMTSREPRAGRDRRGRRSGSNRPTHTGTRPARSRRRTPPRRRRRAPSRRAPRASGAASPAPRAPGSCPTGDRRGRARRADDASERSRVARTASRLAWTRASRPPRPPALRSSSSSCGGSGSDEPPHPARRRAGARRSRRAADAGPRASARGSAPGVAGSDRCRDGPPSPVPPAGVRRTSRPCVRIVVHDARAPVPPAPASRPGPGARPPRAPACRRSAGPACLTTNVRPSRAAARKTQFRRDTSRR